MSYLHMENNDKRQWCTICGEPRGNCTHVIAFTSNKNEAFRIWLAEQERLKKLNEDYKICSF
jgi:hypothetical protein